MWCRLGNKRKREGKYKELLKNKSMCHLRKINFWKERKAQNPKKFDKSMVVGP
jgi:hypothetical protein